MLSGRDPTASLEPDPPVAEVRIPLTPRGELVVDVDPLGRVRLSSSGMNSPSTWKMPFRGGRIDGVIASIRRGCMDREWAGAPYYVADSGHLRREGDVIHWWTSGHYLGRCRARTLAIALGCLKRAAEASVE